MYLNSFKMLNYNKIYKNQIFKTLNKSLINLPTPMNISLMWNFGSLLGVCLMIQILSGLFLAMHYIPNTNMAFQSVMHICRDVNMGWLLRNIHSNGASLFFICMFIHIGRGVYYESYLMTETWTMGVLILLLTMASAFLGYVLPWGQMSFWGATVITNLLSAIPFLGNMMVQWIWGGFSVDNSTLNRFFVFHFITPFIVLLLVLMHLMFLHEKGSNNPLGVSSKTFKIPFTPFFMLKDLMGFTMFFFMMMLIIFFFPYYLGDPDNFIMANSMVTPPHIKPEWYFLFAYAILRSISTKLGGVIALLMSILILAFMPFLNKKKKEQGKQFKMKMQFKYWMFVTTFMLLTWIGARPVELPYMKIGYWLTVTYFKLIIFMTKK